MQTVGLKYAIYKFNRTWKNIGNHAHRVYSVATWGAAISR